MKFIKSLLISLSLCLPTTALSQGIYSGNGSNYVNLGKSIEFLQFSDAKNLVDITAKQLAILDNTLTKYSMAISSRPNEMGVFLIQKKLVPEIMTSTDGEIYHPFGGTITLKVQETGTKVLYFNTFKKTYCTMLKQKNLPIISYIRHNNGKCIITLNQHTKK
jgi:hypothetical protein